MNHPGYTPSVVIDHEYGEPEHRVGLVVKFYIAGPESLSKSDIEDRIDQFKETFAEMNCDVESVKLVEQREEMPK